jgi:hypothetical protein
MQPGISTAYVAPTRERVPVVLADGWESVRSYCGFVMARAGVRPANFALGVRSNRVPRKTAWGRRVPHEPLIYMERLGSFDRNSLHAEA